MAGASIPQGFFGGGMTGGSPIGWSGGQGLGGTQAAVTNPTDSSKLMAYDASTMSTQLTPKAPIPESLGLASGSVGTAGVTGDVASSTKGTLFKPPTPVIPPPTPKVTTPTKTSTTTTAGKPPTASATNPAIKPLQMPQYGPTPLYVNDQWTNSGSQPMATPALGAGPNMFNNSLNALNIAPGTQFFSDGKGGFYTDAAGKVPVSPNVANILKSAGLK